jgi:hypothetical protein
MPLAAAAAQQRVVSGTVADSTGRPVPYVNVEEGGVRRGLTNASGEFRFQTNRKGAIPVGFRRLGYQYLELRVESAGDTTLGVVMQPVATQLATTVVSATARVRALESRGFYSRFADREKGILGGEFVTPEDIQLRNPMRASQLLEQRNGVQVRRIGNCEVTIRCWAILGAGGCSATVYLDGRRMNSLASASLGEVTPETVVYVDELVSPASIAGVEVYPRGVRAPPEFQSLGGSCAIVVIWTR